ncbi:MAG: polyprenyl synthetase family protein [Bacteroidota bacterium]
MSRLDTIKAPINGEMERFEKLFKSSMKSKVPLLNIITNYILRRKGKQLRPMLVFLTANLNGKVTESTYVAASLIELLHTATLIHDDVVDESYERRGFFSINALWKSKIAVLMGDFLLAKGLLLSVNNKAYNLLEIVSDAVKEMSEGELLQIQKSRKLNTSKDQYYEIIRKKTATLISACAMCGASSADASDTAILSMKELGENIGMAFQLKDDLLDYQVNSKIGKPTGNDIKERKLTLPLIYSLNKAENSTKKEILRKFSKGIPTSSSIQEIIEFTDIYGGISFTNNEMEGFRDKALTILASYPDSLYKNSLIELINYTTSRKY